MGINIIIGNNIHNINIYILLNTNIQYGLSLRINK
jgi:hypothetical protein